MAQWEYISIRFSYIGFGITQEFNDLDVNGKRLISTGKAADDDLSKNLPDFLKMAGGAGWELVSHSVETGTAVWHYMNFKRPKIN